MDKLRGDPQLAQASLKLLIQFRAQYRTARDLTIHQLYQAILIAFHRQMGDVISCLQSASSTANGDSSGSDEE